MRDSRQIGCQILGNAVGEILLVGIAAQIGERQNHNRESLRRRRRAVSGHLRIASSDLPDEAIATAGHGLDAASRCGFLVQGAAQGRYLDRQIAFFDGHSRPDLGDNLILWDEFTRSLEQNPQYLFRARADFQRDQPAVLGSPEQAAAVETEALEQEDVGRAKRAPASSECRTSPAARAGPSDWPAASGAETDFGLFREFSEDLIPASLSCRSLAATL